MPVSKPMKLIALRLDEDEKRRLEQLARDRNVTLSHALREGARIYLGELRDRRDSEADRERSVAT